MAAGEIAIASRSIEAIPGEEEGVNLFLERALQKDVEGSWPMRAASYWSEVFLCVHLSMCSSSVVGRR